MQREIEVRVVRYGRKNLMLRATCPLTGKRLSKSAKTDNMKKAMQEAARWENELREGKYAPPSKVKWAAFTERYTEEILPGLAKKSRVMFLTVFNTVERLLKPGRIAELTASRLSTLQAALRKEGKSEATIKTYLGHLQTALRKAAKWGVLPVLPEFPETPRAPKGSCPAKGRPLCLEEHEKMLGAVRHIVLRKRPGGRESTPEQRKADRQTVERWQGFLTALWWSGLRLGEALALRWDGDGEGFTVDLDGRRPMYRIDASAEKGHRTRFLPIVPEFAEILEATPEDQRHGRVFSLPGVVGPNHPRYVDVVSEVICRVGKQSRVVVASKLKLDPETGKRVERHKFASAHDYRRSFGERWASRIMPKDLMELMRHESVDTTLRYYATRNAEVTADVVWDAYDRAKRRAGGSGASKPEAPKASNTIGNTEAAGDFASEQEGDTSSCIERACGQAAGGL